MDECGPLVRLQVLQDSESQMFNVRVKSETSVSEKQLYETLLLIFGTMYHCVSYLAKLEPIFCVLESGYSLLHCSSRKSRSEKIYHKSLLFLSDLTLAQARLCVP